jgi:serine phosphatase RsbU (regulator of sigma subunit)/anti-sigma regulatory factor (Ser/Thr protein kinase)/PAS domain-containing protein
MTPLNLVDISLLLGLWLVAWNTDVLFRCRASNAKSLMLCMGFIAGFTCVGYFMELNAESLDGASAGVTLEFVCGNLSLYLYYLFIADWCQAEVPAWLRVALALEVGMGCLMALPGRYQCLYFTPTGIATGELLPGVLLDYGPFEYLNSAVQLFMFCSTIAMSVHAHRARRLLGDTSILVLFTISAATPLTLSLLQALGVFGSFDPSSLSSIITLGILTYCIVRRRAFDALPQAFETIVATMPEVVCVLDSEGRLLFSNAMADDLWDDLDVGSPLPASVRHCLDQKEFFLNDHYYQLTTIDLPGSDEHQGLIATASDITNLKHINNLLETEQEHMRKDLVLAASIQANALPSVFPPWPGRIDFDIFATMQAAREVGGDFYDFFLVDETHLGVVMADVSGKGMPASLVMMSAKSYIKDHMMAGRTPAKAFELANDRLCAENGAGMFVTAWALLVDLSNGHAQFANAGHNPPLMCHGGSHDWFFVESRPNFVLAGMEGVTYRTCEFDFQMGDDIFLYTDGVTEAMNGAGELFGEDRLQHSLASSGEKDPTRLLPAVRQDIATFVDGAEQSDDITMLGLRINLLGSYLRIPATFEACAVVADFIEGWLTQGRLPPRLIAQVMVVQDEVFSNIMRYAYAAPPSADVLQQGVVASDGKDVLVPAPPEGVRGVGSIGRAAFGEATVELAVEGGQVVLRFIDAGIPFDPTAGSPHPHGVEEIGGRGIILVKGMMDGMAYHYTNGLNILTLSKRVPSDS